jgi:UDP-N-acetyl-D-galactosamine dehydrogenase
VPDVHDPLLSSTQQAEWASIKFVEPEAASYDLVVLAVAHEPFISQWETHYRKCLKPKGLVYDLKGKLPRDQVHRRL